jgi:hypothetical protein
MGFNSISVYGANPAFQSFISQNQVDTPMFGFKFSTSGSELFLGGVNKALFSGEFTWLPLSNEVCHNFKCVNGSNLRSALIGLLAGILR